MALTHRAAAASHVGKVRSNNQDSGFLGRHLFVVADGMGGHAGGDIASAIAANALTPLDHPYASAADATQEFDATLLRANAAISDAVLEHPELAGMGTTVSGLVVVGDQIGIAHIGDSRIYLYRDGELSQITVDHTFVQRLVEAGRITEEEALVHPRRSVLMRVLGDVDSSPQIDTQVMTTAIGDRWLICSDGLSSYVPVEEIRRIMARRDPAERTVERLVNASLAHGAPDNVTAVVVDMFDANTVQDADSASPHLLGSASSPLEFEYHEPERSVRLPSLWPPRAQTIVPTHFEPRSEDYLSQLIAEDRRRERRRRITWLVGVLVLITLLVGAGAVAYRWTQTLYYVGSDSNSVVIYRGIQQNIGPISMHTVEEDSGIPLSSLTDYERQVIEDTINAGSLKQAEQIVQRLEPEQ